MLQSMTAYGRSITQSSFGQMTVEIQAVNRKHLEVSLRLPKELSRFEIPLGEVVKKQVHRGRVTVSFDIRYEEECPARVSVNLPLVGQYQAAFQKLNREFGISCELEPEDLLKIEGIFSTETAIPDESRYLDALRSGLEKALEPFLEMRRKEGELLEKDVGKRLDLLEGLVQKVEALSAGEVEKYRMKLIERVGEAAQSGEEVDERVLKEIALYAEKVDMTEELVRFRAHLSHFRSLIASDQSAIGKTLDFLTQELLRETNTMGAKTSSAEASRHIVEMKGEIEKMREQLQNVE